MKEYSHYTDEELMEEIILDNMYAFDALYRKYIKGLYKFSYSIVKSKEEAENIIQDVFLTFWINRERIEKGSSVKYYIFTICYNSAISIIRKKIKESHFIEQLKDLQDLTQEPVDKQIEFKELDKKLHTIINTLPLRQKEVYLLHKIHGLKYCEISERLNISMNTVENHMARALKTIRLKLSKYAFFAILFSDLFV